MNKVEISNFTEHTALLNEQILLLTMTKMIDKLKMNKRDINTQMHIFVQYSVNMSYICE